MTFDEYTEAAAQREVRVFGTAYRFEPWYYALGLTGDAGEIADKVKRIYRDGDLSSLSQQARDILMYELGDVLWYVNAIAAKFGRSLEDVARLNRAKLDDLERRGALPGRTPAPAAGRPSPAREPRDC